MRNLLFAIVLSATGCHVATGAVVTTVTTKVVTNVIDLVTEIIAFDREFDAEWARMSAEHDFLMRCGGVRSIECRQEFEETCEAKRSCGRPPW